MLTISPVDTYVSAYITQRTHATDPGAPASGLLTVKFRLAETDSGAALAPALDVASVEITPAPDPTQGAYYSALLAASDLAAVLPARDGGVVWLVTLVAGEVYSSIPYRVQLAAVRA